MAPGSNPDTAGRWGSIVGNVVLYCTGTIGDGKYIIHVGEVVV